MVGHGCRGMAKLIKKVEGIPRGSGLEVVIMLNFGVAKHLRDPIK